MFVTANIPKEKLSLRTSPQAGVAIPFKDPRRTEKRYPLETCRGLPRQCAHWLAMTFFSSRVVKPEFLHNFFSMVKSTTFEKVGNPAKAVASFYVNQK